LVAGQVWRLSQDACGCRDVQQALESAKSDEERDAIAAELKGHIWDAAQHPHANHVVQKCVSTMRPAACQFIIDELVEASPGCGQGVVVAAQHRYACRIVQRLVECCADDQLSMLAEALLQNAGVISRNAYGNYVMQHLLQHSTPAQCRHLERVFEAEVRTLGEDTHGSAVLAGALLHGEETFCKRLAQQILREPGLVMSMACARHGHVAVLRMLGHLTGAELEEARALLLESRVSLEESRFGRVVAAHFDEGSESTPSSPSSASQSV